MSDGGVSPTSFDGSTVVADTDAQTASSSDAVVIIRTVGLIILLLFSLVGNALLVFLVAQSSSNVYNPFNAFILSLASFGLVECAFTMSLATGFSIEKIWNFGDFFAGFNSAFIQLQNVGIMLTLVAMSIDRFIAVTRLKTYHTHSRVHHANYIVLYTWIHAVVFALPLLFQAQMIGITCRPFVERCLCGLVEGTSLVFTVLLILLCYCVPLLLIISFLSLVALKAANETKRVKSLNTAEYANYCLQESMLLNEAHYCRYVGFLVVLYLLFKGPYVFIDILTQLDYPPAYQPTLVGNITVIVDGSLFYYQTALSWMMFCFSALYPIITFLQFPGHWRRIKKFLTCEQMPVATATNQFHSSRRHRNLHHKQLRRHRQRMANKKAKAKKKKRSTSIAAEARKKAPSSVSTAVSSEKVAVSSTEAEGGVMFRVPVLYAATDGLHLVASEKTLPTQRTERTKRKANKSESLTNESDSMTAKRNALSVSKSDMQQEIKVFPPSSDKDDDVRPSSVVDKRVDVTGSRDCLQTEEDYDSYLNSDFDADDDTESELNTSANSRTLIWPNKRSAKVKSASSTDFNPVTKIIWSVNSSRNSANSQRKSRFQNDSYQRKGALQDNGDVLHPHTPSPPPNEEDQMSQLTPSHSFIDNQYENENNITKVKLPMIKNKSNCSLSAKGSNWSLREEPTLPGMGEEHLVGYLNNGYESPIPSLISRRESDASVVIKQLGGFPNNRVYPDHCKAFVADWHGLSPHSRLPQHQLRTQDVTSQHIGLMSGTVTTEDLPPSSDNELVSSHPLGGANKMLKIPPFSDKKKSGRAVTAPLKYNRTFSPNPINKSV